jgi:hypothetical protein
MGVALQNLPDIDQEQRFILPSTYDWQEFEAIVNRLAASPGLRITYLDGWIELMTLRESHERIKSLLGMFLEAYLIAIGVEFTPVGSATYQGEAQKMFFKYERCKI